MKILLTGPQGFLGARIAQALDVIPAPSMRNASYDDVRRLLQQVRPDAVIHTAAISDIGVCQQNPEASWQANVLLPQYIAQAGQGMKLVMLSTDQVYSGCSGEGPYGEDEVCPANLYAEHKLEMERRVLAASPDAVLLRATWMYDMPLYGVSNRGNFLMNVLQAAMTGEKIAFPRAQYRGITWAREAAQRMTDALRLPGGVYNYGSTADGNVYDTAARLAQELGLTLNLEEAPARHHLWMDDARLRANGWCFSTTQEGLSACVRAYGLVK